MKKTIKRERKLLQKRGTGNESSYTPWIYANEFNSSGSTHNIVDWKHGRTIELLSDGEALFYYLLRWDDNVADIQEQYPLELDITNRLADSVNIRRIRDGKENMTTDFLVTFINGAKQAYSVKSRRESHPSNRSIEKQWVEASYWKLKGIPWKMLYKSDANVIYANNIRLCVEYYDLSKVTDETGYLKHLIAHKKLPVDLSKEPLNMIGLINQYKEVLKSWK